MQKTTIKFALIFIGITLPLSLVLIYFPILLFLWFAFGFSFFIYYYFNKQAFSYYITDKSIRIEKSWFFGNYVREITFDQIKDIHIMQGILARMFACGSLVFTTTSGLEVGYFGGGVAAGSGVIVGTGGAVPTIVKGRGNMFWDVTEPRKAREILMIKLTEWREVFQQQKMSISLEKMAEKAQPLQPPHSHTIVDELEKLKKLLDSDAITKDEYEKAKKKLLE